MIAGICTSFHCCLSVIINTFLLGWILYVCTFIPSCVWKQHKGFIKKPFHFLNKQTKNCLHKFVGMITGTEKHLSCVCVTRYWPNNPPQSLLNEASQGYDMGSDTPSKKKTPNIHPSIHRTMNQKWVQYCNLLNQHWCPSPASVSPGLDTKEKGFSCSFFHVWDLVSLWEECRSSEMSAGCQRERQRSEAKANPEAARDKQERHLWMEAIVSHPKEIILSAVCIWPTRSCVFGLRPPRKKDRTFFYLCIV